MGIRADLVLWLLCLWPRLDAAHAVGEREVEMIVLRLIGLAIALILTFGFAVIAEVLSWFGVDIDNWVPK